MEHLLTLKQAAEYLQLSERTVLNHVRAGGLPARKVGRVWRFNRDRLIEWSEGADSDKPERAGGGS